MFDFPSSVSQWSALIPQRFRLAESPRAAHGQLRWVDIDARILYRLTVDTIAASQPSCATPVEMPMPDQIACIIPTQQADCWIGFGRQGIWRIRDSGSHEKIIDSPFDSSFQRFNDGCCDEWGRIWITTLIDDKRAPMASLYCLVRDELIRVSGGLMTGNGMAYSQRHRKLWMADTFTRTIRRYDVSAHSTQLIPDGWKHTYTVGTERPDGACLIDDQLYTVAVIDGCRLDVFPFSNGGMATCIPVPLQKPTMPCVVPEPAPGLVLTSAAVTPSAHADDAKETSQQNGSLLFARTETGQTHVHLYRGR